MLQSSSATPAARFVLLAPNSHCCPGERNPYARPAHAWHLEDTLLRYGFNLSKGVFVGQRLGPPLPGVAKRAGCEAACVATTCTHYVYDANQHKCELCEGCWDRVLSRDAQAGGNTWMRMGRESLNTRRTRWATCRYDASPWHRTGTGCTYKTQISAWLSQAGQSFEYYHFLIDFAPRLLFAMSRDGCLNVTNSTAQTVDFEHANGTSTGGRTVVLRAAGWPPQNRIFSFEGHGHSMAAHAAAIFGGQLTVQPYMDARSLCDAAGAYVPYPAGLLQWAQQPRAWLHALRSRVHNMAGITEGVTCPRFCEYVLLLRRRSDDPRARALRDEFYDAARDFLRARGIAYRSAPELSPLPLVAQASLFSRARLVIGPHGGALSNILFCPLGGGLLELGRRLFPVYQNLAAKVGLHYRERSRTSFDETTQRAVIELLGLTVG